MKSLPDDVVAYRKTPEFTAATVPAGLLKSHTTKRGVWGHIRILDGRLLYRILEPIVEEHVLTQERPGVVSPEIAHEVMPLGEVRFFVEFLRCPEP